MRKIILSAALLLPFAVMAQKGYTLKGKVGSLNAPAKVYLQYRAGSAVFADTADVNNGVFEFKGTVEGPVSAQLTLQRDTLSARNETRATMDALSIYLENKTIRITAPDSLKKAVISGSPLNDDNAELKALLKPVTDKEDALRTEYYSKSKEEQRDPAYQRSIEERSEAIDKKKEPLQQQFINKNKKSYVALVTFRGMIGYDIDPDVAEPGFNQFSKKLKETKLGQSIAEAINGAKKTQVGTMATAFTQNDPDGKPVKLSDFKGKYVLVDFWASWCGPCRMENPNVVTAFNTYKDRNFTVLGVSLDREDGKEAWLKAIKDDGLNWTQVSDLKYFNNAVAQLYGIQAIPSNILVDPTGKIVGKNLRGEELQAKLAELIGKETAK